MERFFTELQYQQLISNAAPENIDRDYFPVVNLFLPDENATWLLTRIDPEDTTKAYGLSDWGDGHPEVGTINLNVLDNIEGKYGFEVRKDTQFEGRFPLSAYDRAAQEQGGIIDRLNSRYDITENDAYLKELYLEKYRGKSPGLAIG